MAEEIITQIRNNEQVCETALFGIIVIHKMDLNLILFKQDAAIKNIKYMMEIVNEIKAKVDANPDNFLEQLEDAQVCITKTIIS